MMNFKDFKKTKEDSDTVTMSHEKGHTIKILKRALPHIQQEALKRLPFDDGGKVPETPLQVEPIGDTTPPATTSTQQSATTPPDQTPLEQQAAGTLGGVEQQKLGAQQAAEVQAQTAQGNIPIAEQAQKNADINKESLQKSLDDVTQYTNDFKDHMRSMYINPSAYGQSQTDAQKQQTAIGLFLGGLGGGGTSNVALDFLNKNIERNIDAQKANQETEKNIYGAYQQLYNNDNVTAALTKVSMNDKLLADAQLVAAKLGTTQAQAQYNLLAGKVEADSTDQRMKAAAILNAGGLPKSGAAPNQNPVPGTYQLLVPNAIQKSMGLSGTGVFDNAKLGSQLTAANNAEGVINGPLGDGKGGLHEILSQMYNDIGQGTFTGGLETRVKGAAHALPFIGDIGEKGLNVVQQGEGYKDYALKKTALIQDIGAALHGLVNPSEVAGMVERYAPALGDTPEDIAEKEKSMINTIIKAIPKDELIKAGLWGYK